ncbi:tyrosine-protein kinase receptor Tie-1-like [Apostichopus japonicus]|uniref:tyrosine-protein kinase receptor Tie-1-like n=1 Tax=Stichopus japonicus TaxID=307972 RepID=UPI003AB4E52E
MNYVSYVSCPANRWGPDACDGICDNCYNGGIYDENSGKCICAPGFKGTNCEEECGGNRYTDTCERRCSSSGGADSCSRYLFCLAHPYGCSCNTGWKGLDCLTVQLTLVQMCVTFRPSHIRRHVIQEPMEPAAYRPVTVSMGSVTDIHECVQDHQQAVVVDGQELIVRHLDDDGISSEQLSGTATTRTAPFMVDNVTDGQTLYCQLRKDDQKYAVYNITIDVFDLHVLQSAPKADLITDSTVTISWSAWDEESEDGDPPVIRYTPYYKLASGLNWSLQDTSAPIKTLNFIFTALIPEERYSFCVAAVREGEKGEGPKSPALNATTTCAVDQDGPMNVTAEVAGDDQENVKISWKLPTGGSSCSDGVTL